MLKNESYASDLYTEAMAVPAVRAAGVDIPELLAFDDSRDIVEGVVTIYRRVKGLPFAACTGPLDIVTIHQAIGEQIAGWRYGVTQVDDPNQWLDRPEFDDAWVCFERNAERLTTAERKWSESAISRLETAKPGVATFVHWDLHAHNILVEDGKFVSVIDWGDAGWGETAINYQCLRADMLPTLLEQLRDVDHNLVGRCLYGVLSYALNDVHREEDITQPHRNSGHRRWTNLLRLYSQDHPESWKFWLGDPPPG